MSVEIRPVAADDASAVADIYSDGIADRVATFHTEPVTPQQVMEMMRKAGERPFLVSEREGEAVAFAAVAPYSDFPPTWTAHASTPPRQTDGWHCS